LGIERKLLAMPDILIRCPETGEPVQTGLDTETIIFESLPSFVLPLHCPLCGRTHYWEPKDAWVEGSDPAKAN
jgi:hypothetical protein